MFGWLAALAIVALLAKLAWVAMYASPVPYFDQWDAEGGNLIVPWLQHSLRLQDFFVAHNEHRIAVTRGITLILFEVNGREWDNRVEAWASAFLFAATWVILFKGLFNESSARERLAGFALMAMLAVLPYAWENTLVGFQSQFYAMFLVLASLLYLACRSSLGWASVLGMLLLAIVGLVTMASGLMAPMIAAGVLLTRLRDEALPRSRALAVVGLMLGCALFGAWLVPSVPWHTAMRASSPGDFMHALVAVLFWPFAPRAHEHVEVRWICALILWLPTLWFARAWCCGRRITPGERMALALAGWALAQAAATAYARGHGMIWVWSRYMDIPAMGGIANAFLAMRWHDGAHRNTRHTYATAAWMIVFTGALISRTAYDMKGLDLMTKGLRAQLTHTRDYLASGDPAALAHAAPEIPYPDSGVLRKYLDDSTLRPVLPVSIRPSGLPTHHGVLSRFADGWQALWPRPAEPDPSLR